MLKRYEWCGQIVKSCYLSRICRLTRSSGALNGTQLPREINHFSLKPLSVLTRKLIKAKLVLHPDTVVRGRRNSRHEVAWKSSSLFFDSNRRWTRWQIVFDINSKAASTSHRRRGKMCATLKISFTHRRRSVKAPTPSIHRGNDIMVNVDTNQQWRRRLGKLMVAFKGNESVGAKSGDRLCCDKRDTWRSYRRWLLELETRKRSPRSIKIDPSTRDAALNLFASGERRIWKQFKLLEEAEHCAWALSVFSTRRRMEVAWALNA